MLDGVGIETRSLYPLPAYRQPMPEYAPYADEQRPCAEAASATVLNLPVFFELTDAEIDDVAGTLVTAVGVATAQPVAVQPVAA
jgi:dTDP-4-amino-4,6-dideoxygalactose transaminase